MIDPLIPSRLPDYYPQFIVATPMSGSGIITSVSYPIPFMLAFAVQAVWTGTPVGTFILNVSVDGINWDPETESGVTLTGSGGTYIWDVVPTATRFVQLIYTNSSGNGSLTAGIYGKKSLYA